MNDSTTPFTQPARAWQRWLAAAGLGLAALAAQAQTTGCAPAEYASLPIVNTGLPVVQIWTENLAPIVDRENYIKGCMRITDGSVVRYGQGLYHGTLEIRGRGNTTWNMPKKPYRLRLTSSAQVLDMPTERDWVLLANFADKTMLRTDVGFELSRRIGFAWTPRMRHADFYLNNEFLGSYQIGERVEIGPDRVAITKMTTSDTTAPAIEGGYLIQKEYPDRLETGDVAFTTSLSDAFLMDDPSGSAVQPAQLVYISNWMQSLENAILRQDFSPTGVPQWIDVDTVVQYYLVQELLKNKDAAMGSDVNFYKDRGAIMKMGPLWDFDISAGNIDFYPSAMYPQGWYLRNTTAWFDLLMQTPEFKERVRKRWKPFKSSISDLSKYIDAQAKMLERSQQANFQRWPILDTYVWPNQVVTGSYKGEVSWLKDWLKKRVEWMDKNINKD